MSAASLMRTSSTVVFAKRPPSAARHSFAQLFPVSSSLSVVFIVHARLFAASACLVALTWLGHGWSAAQEWPRFRGPNGSGVSLAKNVPTAWTAKDLRWKAALAGVGHSSPVIWGQKIFV